MTERIFVTRMIPAAGLELLRKAGVEVVLGEHDAERPVERAVLERGIRDADVALTLLTESIDRSMLSLGTRLRGIANYAVGFNNIDVSSATSFGIPVSNTPGILTETTADFTWALLLAAARRVVEGDQYTRGGRFHQWGPTLLLGHDVGPGPEGQQKTLGIIGFGRIGQAVARRAAGFNMRVLAFDPPIRGTVEASTSVEWVELDELLSRSDFVTMHPTLTEDTQHLIGERELRMMKPSSYLVNVSRGPVVDEDALVRALRAQWIAGAALDVYEREPRLAEGLIELPNVILAPHMASASVETRDQMAVIAARNALAFLRGERGPDTINPKVYESDAYRRRAIRQ